MSLENVEIVPAARVVLRPLSERARQRRTLDQRLFLRFPALYRRPSDASMRLPPRSRLRRLMLARAVALAYAQARVPGLARRLRGSGLGDLHAVGRAVGRRGSRGILRPARRVGTGRRCGLYRRPIAVEGERGHATRRASRLPQRHGPTPLRAAPRGACRPRRLGARRGSMNNDMRPRPSGRRIPGCREWARLEARWKSTPRVGP